MNGDVDSLGRFGELVRDLLCATSAAVGGAALLRSLSRTIRLEPGTTKNGEGREVSMTKASMSCWRAGSVVRVPTIMCLPGQMVNESKIFESSGGTPVCRLECPTYFFMTSSAPPPATSVGQVWPRA